MHQGPGVRARPLARSRGGGGLELTLYALVDRHLPDPELLRQGFHRDHAVVGLEQVHEPADEIRESRQDSAERQVADLDLPSLDALMSGDHIMPGDRLRPPHHQDPVIGPLVSRRRHRAGGNVRGRDHRVLATAFADQGHRLPGLGGPADDVRAPDLQVEVGHQDRVGEALSRRYCSAIALPRKSGTGLLRSEPSAETKTNWRTPAARAASMRLRFPCSSTDSGVSEPPREAELAVVVTTSAPAQARSSEARSLTSPSAVSTPRAWKISADFAERTRARTRLPRARRASTIMPPNIPAAPATRITPALRPFRPGRQRRRPPAGRSRCRRHPR